MLLSEGFVFSQSSLQDYVDCRRRFHLRYILHLAWPAVESEPVLENERYMQQGERFHRMVHQHLSGVPAERLSGLVDDVELAGWWGNYLHDAQQLITPAGLKKRYAEFVLSCSLEDCRLLAKYDLALVHEQGQITIVDWKTSRKKPVRQWLEKRLQSRLYPYLLVEAGARLVGGKPILPEQVQMVYWYPAFPDSPEIICYNTQKHQEGAAYLSGLINEIQRLDESDFSMTSHTERCAYCVYRSLCERGVRAGNFDQVLDWLSEEAEPREGVSSMGGFDFEQVGEISF
ncbi:MAG: PD-(D/E)XK nuclease family protein [Anaerolineales bacterium]|nr:PD-(D/E)XK nuclease family protein [Anaerolineales bacterium]